MKNSVVVLIIIASVSSAAFAQAPLVPIYDIQYLAPGQDTSAYFGDTVSSGGVVTSGTGLFYAGSGVSFYIGDPAGGPWSGIIAICPEPQGFPDLVVGDSVLFTALVTEAYYQTTLIVEPGTIEYRAFGLPEPPPAEIPASYLDLSGIGDSLAVMYEGVFCRIYDLTVDTVINYSNTSVWVCHDSTGVCLIREASDSIPNSFRPDEGTEFWYIQGVVGSHINDIHLQPRYIRDFRFNQNQLITLFIGNNDGSPFHVPYQGIVDIPVWINPYGMGGRGGGSINLITFNYAISERLGGTFFYPWPYTFSPPGYYQGYSMQLLGFTAVNPPDSLIHLADFSFRMDIDEVYMGDTLHMMNSMVNFVDSTGYILLPYSIQISQLVIDGLTLIDEVQNQPEEISLLQNYPNPFNAQTTIEFALPEESDVELAVYDLLGRKIEMLVDEERQAGQYEVNWNASDLSSGVYFYRLQAGDMIETKRMVLLK